MSTPSAAGIPPLLAQFGKRINSNMQQPTTSSHGLVVPMPHDTVADPSTPQTKNKTMRLSMRENLNKDGTYISAACDIVPSTPTHHPTYSAKDVPQPDVLAGGALLEKNNSTAATTLNESITPPPSSSSFANTFEGKRILPRSAVMTKYVPSRHRSWGSELWAGYEANGGPSYGPASPPSTTSATPYFSYVSTADSSQSEPALQQSSNQKLRFGVQDKKAVHAGKGGTSAAAAKHAYDASGSSSAATTTTTTITTTTTTSPPSPFAQQSLLAAATSKMARIDDNAIGQPQLVHESRRRRTKEQCRCPPAPKNRLKPASTASDAAAVAAASSVPDSSVPALQHDKKIVENEGEGGGGNERGAPPQLPATAAATAATTTSVTVSESGKPLARTPWDDLDNDFARSTTIGAAGNKQTSYLSVVKSAGAGGRTVRIECPTCTHVVTSKLAFVMHQLHCRQQQQRRWEHEQQQQQQHYQRNQFKCPACFRTFGKTNSLKIHNSTCQPYKYYVHQKEEQARAERGRLGTQHSELYGGTMPTSKQQHRHNSKQNSNHRSFQDTEQQHQDQHGHRQQPKNGRRFKGSPLAHGFGASSHAGITDAAAAAVAVAAAAAKKRRKNHGHQSLSDQQQQQQQQNGNGGSGGAARAAPAECSCIGCGRVFGNKASLTGHKANCRPYQALGTVTHRSRQGSRDRKHRMTHAAAAHRIAPDFSNRTGAGSGLQPPLSAASADAGGSNWYAKATEIARGKTHLRGELKKDALRKPRHPPPRLRQQQEYDGNANSDDADGYVHDGDDGDNDDYGHDGEGGREHAFTFDDGISIAVASDANDDLDDDDDDDDNERASNAYGNQQQSLPRPQSNGASSASSRLRSRKNTAKHKRYKRIRCSCHRAKCQVCMDCSACSCECPTNPRAKFIKTKRASSHGGSYRLTSTGERSTRVVSPPRFGGGSSRTKAKFRQGPTPLDQDERPRKRARAPSPYESPEDADLEVALALSMPSGRATDGGMNNSVEEEEWFELPSSAEEDAIDDLMFVSYDVTLMDAQEDDAEDEGEGGTNGDYSLAGDRSKQSTNTANNVVDDDDNDDDVVDNSNGDDDGEDNDDDDDGNDSNTAAAAAASSGGGSSGGVGSARPPSPPSTSGSGSINSSEDNGSASSDNNMPLLPNFERVATEQQLARGETILLIN